MIGTTKGIQIQKPDTPCNLQDYLQMKRPINTLCTGKQILQSLCTYVIEPANGQMCNADAQM